MKTSRLVLACTTLLYISLFPSCKNNSEAEKEQHEQDTALTNNLVDRNEITHQISDSVSALFMKELDEIDNDLISIRDQQGIIVVNEEGKTEGLTKKDQIRKNIASLRSALETNKKKLTNLYAQIKKHKKEQGANLKNIEELTAKLDEQQKTLTTLTEQLTEKSAQIDALTAKVSSLEQTNGELAKKNGEMDKNMHKAYIAYGTAKELKEKKILKSDGGILGLGSKDKITDNIDKSLFTEVDTREATVIPISGKNVKLVTFHPKSSYELNKKDEQLASLTIKDPEQFWGTSRYLVVEVKK